MVNRVVAILFCAAMDLFAADVGERVLVFSNERHQIAKDGSIEVCPIRNSISLNKRTYFDEVPQYTCLDIDEDDAWEKMQDLKISGYTSVSYEFVYSNGKRFLHVYFKKK